MSRFAKILRLWRCGGSPWRSSENTDRRAGSLGGPLEALVPRASCARGAERRAPRLRSRAAIWLAAGKELEVAARELAAHGDVTNARFAELQLVRRLVLLGRVRDAERALWSIDLRRAPARLVGVAELIRADIAVRRLSAGDAKRALARARRAAELAQIPSLEAEIERATRELEAPVARLLGQPSERAITLAEVEALASSGVLLVDACRREVRSGDTVVPLVTRPILFSLAVTLARGSPEGVTRETLIREAFGGKSASESLRARLRVEIGRLRRALLPLAEVRATPHGFTLTARQASRPLLLLPPHPGDASALVALLSAGESWSTSALAIALGTSQRSIQRALGGLEADGRVTGVGRGRSRRWVAPPSSGFATTLLLVARPSRG